MNTYLIDYYLLDQKGGRENEFYETIELEAESDDDPKKIVCGYLSAKDIGYCDVEIFSICEKD